MQTSPFHRCLEAFRAAIASDDFSSAETILRELVAICGPNRNTALEVAEARDLLQWAIPVVTAAKARVASELGRLTTVATGYRPPRKRSTWHIAG